MSLKVCIFGGFVRANAWLGLLKIGFGRSRKIVYKTDYETQKLLKLPLFVLFFDTVVNFLSSLRMIFKNVASIHTLFPFYLELIPSLLLLGGTKKSNKRIVHPCIYKCLKRHLKF
jgi:hypothetical protein